METVTSHQPFRIFLCHSSGDKPAVRELYQRLRNDGFEPWLDEEDLLPGQNWQQEIPKAIRKSHVVVVCISRSSINKSGYVQREIKFALDVANEQAAGTIFLIPLKLEAGELPQELEQWHCVNFFEERGYEKLTKSLHQRAADLNIKIRADPPPDSSGVKVSQTLLHEREGNTSHRSSSGIALSDNRSQAVLLSLYVGLSLLLLLVARLDPDRSHTSSLSKATNVYGIQALAGAALGFWRLWKKADKRKELPALSSLSICVGLVLWAIGLAVWTWTSRYVEPKSPGPHDIFFMTSNLCWLVTLLLVFKTLERRSLQAISSLTKVLVPVALSLLITGLPTWIAWEFGRASLSNGEIACYFVYFLLTFSTALLAVGLLLGEENRQIPFPVHQCIRYLAVASAIYAIAILAFTVTINIPSSSWRYYNGGPVDWLFLTAMYCWGVSAVKCPVTHEVLQYSFHTRRSKVVGIPDLYRASEIAKECSPTEPLIDSESIDWILANIPRCWRVVKLGNLVVGSTFVFPAPRHLIDGLVEAQARREGDRLEEVRKWELEIFEEVKKNPLTWECLYLADASILTKHRRRRLAFRSFCMTIEDIATEYDIEVYCWTTTTERTKLAEKIRDYFDHKSTHKKVKVKFLN